MHVRHILPALLLPLMVAACASTSTFPLNASALRVAQDLPVHFITEDGDVGVADGCRSPLVDPRDQTRIRMLRSGAVGSAHHGDYEVPEGRYGVGRGELLRIECATGQALGIVAN
ncbi:MAG: hypothetical protein KFH98_10285 [Gemmatimonadetes bacterium]|nr:hypothetical protein [Gemmatimonadota bacterium]